MKYRHRDANLLDLTQPIHVMMNGGYLDETPHSVFHAIGKK